MISGGLIRLWCFHALGKFFTWYLAIKDEHKLITRGPYAYVRHPAYTSAVMLAAGSVVTCFGEGSWYEAYDGLGTWWGKLFAVATSAVLFTVPVLLLPRVNREDEVLKKEFGAEWERYAKKTPYKLIPFVY